MIEELYEFREEHEDYFRARFFRCRCNEARHKRDLYQKRKDDTNYKYLRNKVIDLIKKAKEQYNKHVIEENKN